MNSIFCSEDVKYDKEFVTDSLIFIQSNGIDNFDEIKEKILIKAKSLRERRTEDNAFIVDITLQKIYSRLNILNAKDRKVNDLKWKIFYMMKKIIVKNINNYQKLCRNSILGANFNSDEEIESECFLVFENCVYKFVSDNGNNDFYFYFNKSLSRSLYKIFLKNVKDVDSIGSNTSYFSEVDDDYGFERNLKHTHMSLSIDFIISNFDFDSDCLKVINSKLKGERMSDFLKADGNTMTQKVYEKSLKRIKAELTLENDFDEQMKRLEKHNSLQDEIDEIYEPEEQLELLDKYVVEIEKQFSYE